MKRYMALLRGINISGKNKVVMAELKKEFESLKFESLMSPRKKRKTLKPLNSYTFSNFTASFAK